VVRSFASSLSRGFSDQNIRFADLTAYLEHIGFTARTSGGHTILTRPDVEEIINLQPKSDGTAKPYQVRQVRAIVLNYRLGVEDA